MSIRDRTGGWYFFD
ncbi:hypothetical protein EVY06_17800 [Citrobacter koseri]|uniref:Uncharacterized protein n=1 Tax=Citrobacter koseri TaxID=545 RepID=A0AAQ0VCI7_CITKO|nr:hypothetical protein EGX86_18420 [Citrobacter koseri]QCQ73585.1 hypothetical protein FD428_12175 [Citrobacter sp. TBCP-5362]MBE0024337.1 hypothetical protein [Citrobacter koseri]MBE0081827.1 hypothetical protein [Citrobacter koseri]PWY12616.1 hypothetical protein DL345_09065 [Citrobacter koseri]